MRYCSKCGAQLEDNDLFCTLCGSKVEDAVEPAAAEPVAEEPVVEKSSAEESSNQNSAPTDPIAPPPEYVDVEDMNPEESVAGAGSSIQKESSVNFSEGKEKIIETAKKIGKKKLLIGAGVVAVLIIGIIAFFQLRKQVDVNSCIKVDFTGYNTVGKVKYSLDEDDLLNAVLAAKGKKPVGSFDDFDAESMAISSKLSKSDFKIEFDKEEGLSNGDKVKMTVTVNEDAEKALGVKFVSSDQVFTVSKLQDAQRIDIFNNVSVTFTGTSPNASISVKNNSTDSKLKNLRFNTSKNYGISEGDVITVTVDMDSDTALNSGYIFETTSKDYKCEKVAKAINSLESLSSDNLTVLQKKAKDKVESYFAQNSSYVSCTDLKYEGGYVLYKDNTASNDVYIIYSGTVKYIGSSAAFDETLVYFPVEISTVIVDKDGKLSDKSFYPSISGLTNLSYGFFSSVPGYTDGKEMYTKLITAKKDSYKYTISGDVIKTFGQ